VIVMLLALVFRGVAFEFRWVAKPRHRKWDVAFAGGSTLAAFAQGVILGGLLQGPTVVDRAFAGGSFDWATPFSLMCGLGVVAGYALLGACWLVLKTEGEVAVRARRLGRALLVVLLGFIGLVSLWTPLAFPHIAERWFAWPNLAYLAPIPLATLALAWLCWRSLGLAHDLRPFVAAVGIFLLAYVGLVVSNAPYLVPRSVTFWEAAAAPASQTFLLVGTVFLLPLVLAYTAFVFWVFRGKVAADAGYH
jgi:cytochrome d ubiquinol oxidase subunit II